MCGWTGAISTGEKDLKMCWWMCNGFMCLNVGGIYVEDVVVSNPVLESVEVRGGDLLIRGRIWLQ